MERVIDLLKSEREETKRLIEFFASYSEKLEEANEYLLQIERALTVLNETEKEEEK